MSGLLIIEPFYGGSHKQMVDLLQSEVSSCEMFTLPAKKWHWKARTSALYFSQQIPMSENYRVLFASSVLNLTELIALRPDLGKLHKILYFHENQLIYPVKKQQERDFQYGYNQILSSLVADVVVFNSSYNMESFLSSINSFLKLIPDHRPKGLEETIRPKCRVLYFPLNLPSKELIDEFGVENRKHMTETICGSSDNLMNDCDPCLGKTIDNISTNRDKGNIQQIDKYKMETDCDRKDIEPVNILDGPLHIVWAHRWEHDKDPESFFAAMIELSDAGCKFHLSVLGEQFTDVPEIFDTAKTKLSSHILHWGYQTNKTDFIDILKMADVSVSTALHEFFGVSTLESVYYGCYPLCPNRLVYPEIFAEDYLYNTNRQLIKTLKRFCKFPALVRNHQCKVEIEKYLWENLSGDYLELLKGGNIMKNILSIT